MCKKTKRHRAENYRELRTKEMKKMTLGKNIYNLD